MKTRRLLRQLRGTCLSPFTSGACSYSVSRVESEDAEKRAMECGESTGCVSTSEAQARVEPHVGRCFMCNRSECMTERSV